MQLKLSHREVLILRLREDLSFAEIASITGVSEGSLRVRYQRALKQMRKFLGSKGGNHHV
jgi:DNA-directed RNA polymerase specialized sigma24 family protein